MNICAYTILVHVYLWIYITSKYLYIFLQCAYIHTTSTCMYIYTCRFKIEYFDSLDRVSSCTNTDPVSLPFMICLAAIDQQVLDGQMTAFRYLLNINCWIMYSCIGSVHMINPQTFVRRGQMTSFSIPIFLCLCR